jgi:hypothetical protein
MTGHGCGEHEHWHYRALAGRMLLAKMAGDDDALLRVSAEIESPYCAGAVTVEILSVAANFLTVMAEDGYGVVGHLEQLTAYALDELAGQMPDPGGGTA